MARERPPSFQFYPRDFLSDPAVLAMSLTAVGAYIRLLCIAWDQYEPGVLPDDDKLLSRYVHCTPLVWSKIRCTVRAAFDSQQRPGWLVQKRMVAERNAQAQRYMQASLAGKDGARKRWKNDGVPIATPFSGDSETMTPASASASAIEPTPPPAAPPSRARAREAPCPGDPAPAGGLVTSLVKNLDARRPTTPAKKETP